MSKQVYRLQIKVWSEIADDGSVAVWAQKGDSQPMMHTLDKGDWGLLKPILNAITEEVNPAHAIVEMVNKWQS